MLCPIPEPATLASSRLPPLGKPAHLRHPPSPLCSWNRFYISHKVLSHYEKIKLTVKSSKSQPLLIIAPVASLLLVALAVYLNLHPLLLLLLLLAQLLNPALTPQLQFNTLLPMCKAAGLCCLAAPLLCCKRCISMRLQQTGV